jgi:tRNA(fMet)-specific endonuclease VapC
VVSELAWPAPDAGVERRFTAAQGSSVISVLTWHELKFGIARLPASKRKALLTEFLETVVGVRPPLPYDARAAEWHALERARLEGLGTVKPFVDGQIAAIAKINGLTLVTRNLRDFEGFRGVRLERWHLA